MLSVIVEALLIPITSPLLGEKNAMQSRRSSTRFIRVDTLARAISFVDPAGPERMKSIVCDSGSATRSYDAAMSVFDNEMIPPATV